jgi:parvulin-like peptidyl-prolyl isomerase
VPPERHGDILRGLIREELLMQAVGTAGLEREPAVKARVETARRQVLIDEFLRRAMASAGEVDEEEMRRAYRENMLRYLVETAEVSHIMVATAAEAEAVRTELLAGKDFADMARERSQDEASADTGGKLGAITTGQTSPEFEAVAFRLKDGELSEVVRTEQGYHILKGGPHGSALRPFEEVRDELRQMATQAKQQEVVRRVLAELERAGGVEILDERLK